MINVHAGSWHAHVTNEGLRTAPSRNDILLAGLEAAFNPSYADCLTVLRRTLNSETGPHSEVTDVCLLNDLMQS